MEKLTVKYFPLRCFPACIDLSRSPAIKNQIPESLEELKSLTNLNLGSNSIRRLPKLVNVLSCLTSLDISHNGLEIAEILKIGRKERGLRLVSLERLKLQNNELTEGPTATETLTTLTELE